jgi:hypothetical protein
MTGDVVVGIAESPGRMFDPLEIVVGSMCDIDAHRDRGA